MKKLPIWVVTDKFPAFYDSESATAIEQTAKVYGKMNELIEEYNKFVDGINGTIEAYQEELTADYNLFKQSINTQIYDFTHVVELKIMEHEQTTDEKIEAYYTQLEANFNAYKNSLTALVEKYSEDIQNDFTEFTSGIENLITNYKNDMQQAYDTFTEDIVSRVGSWQEEVNRDISSFKQSVNTSVSNMNNEIESFKVNMNNDFTSFKNGVNADNANFKNGVNETITEQNQTIAEAKEYMQDNLPEVSAEIINSKIADGSIQVGLTYDEETEALNLIVAEAKKENEVLLDNFVPTEINNPYTLLSDYNFKVGEKYIVSAYTVGESQYWVENKEVTVENLEHIPSNNSITGFTVQVNSFAYGTCYMQFYNDGNNVIYDLFSGDNGNTCHSDAKITLIKVNE